MTNSREDNRTETKVETSDGLSLYVEVQGEGPAILFSCAYCTTHENWRPQVAPLVAAGFRVVLWDYRGHGRSTPSHDPAAYTIERVVDDLTRVLDHVSPDEPVVLAGLSFGGLASLHTSVAHPERVRALALFGSGPGFKNPEAAAKWMAQVTRTAQFLEERGFEPFVAGKAAATCIGRDPSLPAARAAAAAIEAQDPRAVGLFGLGVAGPAPPVIDALAGIAVPALVLVGEEDAAYRRAADVMAAKLPNARAVVLPGAGHILNIEAEAAFNAELLAFLQSLPPASPLAPLRSSPPA